MKKFIALVLALVMILSLCTVAFAAYTKLAAKDMNIKASLITDVLKKIVPTYTKMINSAAKIVLSGWNDSVLDFANKVGEKVYNSVASNTDLASSTNIVAKILMNPDTVAKTVAKCVYYLGSFYYT